MCRIDKNDGRERESHYISNGGYAIFFDKLRVKYAEKKDGYIKLEIKGV